MRIRQYGPKRGNGTGVAIFAPRPLGGDVHNTDGRYDYIAQQTGHTIFAAYRPISMRMLTRAVRSSQTSAHRAASIYAKIATRAAEELSTYRDFVDWPIRIGWGDSASGLFVALMQRSWPRPFDGLLLRESINLHAPEPIDAGIQRITNQPEATQPWDTDALRHVVAFQANAPESTYDKARRLLSPQLRKLDFAALGSVMCGTQKSVDVVEELAADPDTALRYVGFTRGITGPREAIIEFGPYLEGLRTNALPLNARSDPASISANAIIGTHADLLNPSLAIVHIEQTRGLIPGKP